jgi:hypothetical protein
LTLTFTIEDWLDRALRAPHGSGALITAVHCFRIVFSMPPQSAAMHFCMVASGAIKRIAQAAHVFFPVIYKLTSP